MFNVLWWFSYIFFFQSKKPKCLCSFGVFFCCCWARLYNNVYNHRKWISAMNVIFSKWFLEFGENQLFKSIVKWRNPTFYWDICFSWISKVHRVVKTQTLQKVLPLEVETKLCHDIQLQIERRSLFYLQWLWLD